MIPLTECTAGTVYAVHSRNLLVAVYDGNTGFIGVRRKFGEEYLFTEYHADTGPPYGTVRPDVELGTLPEGIKLAETFPPLCKQCEREVSFDAPVASGGKGWVHTIDGSPLLDQTSSGSTSYRLNSPLFEFLKGLEGLGNAAYDERQRKLAERITLGIQDGTK